MPDAALGGGGGGQGGDLRMINSHGPTVGLADDVASGR